VEALGINAGFLIAQIVNFGIIFFVLARFVWPRVLNMLDERQARIAKSLDDARAAEEARANAERERDRLLSEARAEGQLLIDEARQRGDEQRKQMIREAEREAEERRAQARIQSEEERNRMLGDARDQIVRLAMAAAERLIGTSLDETSQRATIEKFFTEVPAEAKNLGARVEVISAVPLTDAEQAELKRLTGADEVEYHVDPDILGGLILRSGDKVVDGSVRGDLAALSHRLR
jgi:F-type H+-transporting ATPase subunit b